MSGFASTTKVPVEKTLMEIQKLLAKHKANDFGYLVRGQGVMVGFKYQNLAIKMVVKLPPPPSERASQASISTFNQLVRQRYRQLLLCIKAKLEGVACGLETVEQAFLPYIVLTDGSTVGEKAIPALGQWNTGDPKLLLSL